jgi:hypothetical protein
MICEYCPLPCMLILEFIPFTKVIRHYYVIMYIYTYSAVFIFDFYIKMENYDKYISYCKDGYMERRGRD